jgi:type I restriction enzyme S subunit
MSTLLYQGLADQSVTDWLTENAVGTTMLNLNTTIVGNLPVPEMTGEAEAIAHAAARADDLVRALANEVRTLRGLRSRLLAALLTGKAVIPPEYNGLLGVAS